MSKGQKGSRKDNKADEKKNDKERALQGDETEERVSKDDQG